MFRLLTYTDTSVLLAKVLGLLSKVNTIRQSLSITRTQVKCPNHLDGGNTRLLPQTATKSNMLLLRLCISQHVLY